MVAGAKPAPFPGFIEPCHPTLREQAPPGVRWIHEIKFDGYRTQAHLRGGRPGIYTRRGHDWTVRFQTIADALTRLGALPHLGRRPLKLVRHVRGTTFYHKGKLPPVPEAVHRLTIAAKARGSGSMMLPACSD